MTELQIGKAGEHLVCSDLITKGYAAFLSDQGSPFDVVLVTPSGLKRVQVRTTTKLVSYAKSAASRVYRFSLKVGKGRKRRVTDADLFAFVALDIRQVAYLEPYQLTRAGRIITICEFRPPQTQAERRYNGGAVRAYNVRLIDAYGDPCPSK